MNSINDTIVSLIKERKKYTDIVKSSKRFLSHSEPVYRAIFAIDLSNSIVITCDYANKISEFTIEFIAKELYLESVINLSIDELYKLSTIFNLLSKTDYTYNFLASASRVNDVILLLPVFKKIVEIDKQLSELTSDNTSILKEKLNIVFSYIKNNYIYYYDKSTKELIFYDNYNGLITEHKWPYDSFMVKIVNPPYSNKYEDHLALNRSVSILYGNKDEIILKRYVRPILTELADFIDRVLSVYNVELTDITDFNTDMIGAYKRLCDSI